MEPKFGDSILFDVNKQTLDEMTLSQHVVRLENMSKFLTEAIKANRNGISGLKDTLKNQSSSLKSSYQILQSQIKNDLERMKDVFDPSMLTQKKQLNDIKAQTGKITAQQLTAKKTALTLQTVISKCENQIGFTQLKMANRGY